MSLLHQEKSPFPLRKNKYLPMLFIKPVLANSIVHTGYQLVHMQ